MIKYLVHKLVYGVSVLVGVLTLVFFIFSFVPDPSRELAGQNESEEVVQAIRRKFNLDLQLSDRYVLFINDLSPVGVWSDRPESRLFSSNDNAKWTWFQTDGGRHFGVKTPYLGRSYITERPVMSVIQEAFPGTAILAFTALLFALISGMFLGVVAAMNKGKFTDRFILLLSAVGMSGPSFFMAILIAWLGGYVWYQQTSVNMLLLLLPLMGFLLALFIRGNKAKWVGVGLLAGCLMALFITSDRLLLHLPGTQLPMNGSLYSVDVWTGEYIAWRNLILPAITLGIRPLAVITQLMRNSVLEVFTQDYIRTARAKGLPEYKVLLKHVLRNASNPVLTAASGWLASMLAGAVFVEFVFGWKGMGMEIFRSLEKNDLPVVMGAVMVIATLFVIINVLVDLIYAWLDPRVRSGLS